MVTINFHVLTVSIFSVVNCLHSQSTHQLNQKQSTLALKGFTNFFWDFANTNQLNSINVSSDCKLSLTKFNQDLIEGQEWPLIMLDSSGQFPFDSLGTGYADYGNFDQCLQINHVNYDSSLRIIGQHCTISFLPTLNQSHWQVNPFTRNKVISDDLGLVLQLGVCLPSLCSKIDLDNIMTKAMDSIDWKHLIVNQCTIKTSLVEEVVKSNLIQTISLVLLLSIVLVNLYCTWYHWYFIGSTVNSSNWSEHFSLIKSYNSLIVPNPIPRNTFLTRLSITVHLYSIGIHALIWFMTGLGWGLFANSAFTLKHRHKWWVRSSPDYFAEILYFYGGITHSFSLWKVTGPSTSLISSFKHMIIRMISITINLIPVTCFMIIMPLIVTGPLNYSLSEHVSKICSKNFLGNLFFWQNNIRPISEICHPHTWSIAVEYQLLPLIIILIHLYKRSPKIAVTINILIVVAGFMYIAIYVFINNPQPHDLSRVFDPREIITMHETLLKSPSHIWIYLSSPLWAYLILSKGQQSIKLGKQFILIVLSLHILPIVWVGLSDYDGPVLNSIYWVFYRLVNLSFYSSIVLANCEQLRDFFSHPSDQIVHNQSANNLDTNNHRFLHFVSTLLRSSYYAHICVIVLYYNYQRTTILSTKVYIFFVFELIFLSFVGGFIFHLFVANPISSVFSSLLTRQKVDNLRKSQ